MTKRARDLRRYRDALGITQVELAEALDYAGPIVVSHKERGARKVTARDLLAVECLLRRARRWPIKT